jgi:hypothetical protein
MAEDNEKEGGGFMQTVKDGVKAVGRKVAPDAYQVVKDVKDELQAGNQLKKDIEGKNIVNQDGTPIKDKGKADNYAHSVADARIAQKGKAYAAVAFAAGVGKEAYDIATKTWNGQDIRETLRDSRKDMDNNLRGLTWGLEHPNEDAAKYFAQLDLKENTIIPGYDNQIAQARRITDVERKERNMQEALLRKQNERELKALEGQRAAQAAKKFDAGKIPDAKTPKKEKVQVPLAPKTSSVTLPIPAWQQKTKGGR